MHLTQCELIVGIVVIQMNKSYLELIEFKTFEERFEYLKLDGIVCNETFGFDRYLNQKLYSSYEWKRRRQRVIVRDMGCDLGMLGHDIIGKILIHHINPITIDDIKNRNPIIFDENNLICVSHNTHNAIHYGSDTPISSPIFRSPNDTCPWKK